MKRFVALALTVGLCLGTGSAVMAQGFKPSQKPPIQVPPTQTPTAVGFSTLLCVADALLGGAALPGDPIVLFGDQVILEAISGVTTDVGVSTIDVMITHGDTSSEHMVTFIDEDGSDTLNCGDTIVAVDR